MAQAPKWGPSFAIEDAPDCIPDRRLCSTVALAAETLKLPKDRTLRSTLNLVAGLCRLEEGLRGTYERLRAGDIDDMSEELRATESARDRLDLFATSNRDYCKQAHSFLFGGEHRRARLDALLFHVTTMCNVNIALGLDARLPEVVRLPTASSVLDASLSSLVVSDRALLAYSVKDLMAALAVLEDGWHILRYHQSLRAYLDALWTRAGTIMRGSQGPYVHNAESYRVPLVDEAGAPVLASGLQQYSHTQALAEDVQWAVTSMRAKLYAHEALSSAEMTVGPGTLRKVAAMAANMGEWAKRYAAELVSESVEKVYKKHYIARCIRPSERERYFRDYPGKIPTAVTLLKCMRGKEVCQRICERATLSAREVEAGARVDAVGKDVMRLRMVDYLARNFCGGLEWDRDFVYHDWDVLDSLGAIRSSQRPLIVQTFNYYSLYFGGKTYQAPDFAHAFSAWFLMMKSKFGCRHGEHDLSPLEDHVFAERPRKRPAGGGAPENAPATKSATKPSERRAGKETVVLAKRVHHLQL